MIFGIGSDIVEFARMQALYERYGDTFARRVLMPEEYALFTGAKRPARFLAMRFAAKEAIVKAMGTGFAHGVWVRDVGTVPDSRGQPQVIYSERGARVRDRLGIGAGYLTLTDEAGLVFAVAVLERKAA